MYGPGQHKQPRGQACRQEWVASCSLANDRLKTLDDGHVRIELKKAWSNGTTPVDLEPLALIARLAALVPPPRRHLTRYFGVLSSHSASRSQVVPAPTAPVPADDKGRPAGKSRYIPWADLLRKTFGFVAGEMLIEKGVNRVILATDGDFNVGVSSRGALERLIERKRDTGVYLTVLGFGMGNLKDSMLEALANKGNGNHAYIDSFTEARRVLVEDVAGTLITVAKDVKVQVELNPAQVTHHRLVGYENRLLRQEDLVDDKSDAAEMGAGQRVTALYEITPTHGKADRGIALKYQKTPTLAPAATSGELATIKIRYKLPAGGDSHELVLPVRDQGTVLAATTPAFRLAAAVAAFGMILRESPHQGTATLALVRELAMLIDKAQSLRGATQ